MPERSDLTNSSTMSVARSSRLICLEKSTPRDILQFLEERKLVPILDPTNDDPAYLRARMRKEILPQLSRSFGKGISDNLILLSQRASELKSYLDKKISQASIEHGVWGMYVSTENLERIEMRHLLQSLAREKEITFPRGVLESLLDWLEQKLPNKRVVIGNCHFITDRQGFYLLSEKKPISFLRSQRSQSVCFTSK